MFFSNMAIEGRMTLALVLFISGIAAIPIDSQPQYHVGVGIHDITGPAAEINMMGYAKAEQRTAGIHQRLYSRAFVIGDIDDTNRVVYVVAEIGMMTQIIRNEVLNRLKDLYGDRYNSENVMLSSTHTHSGPGAYHQYVLISITSLGFYEPSFIAIAEGIVQSIVKAHNNVQPANIYENSGELIDSSINRSPSSYLNNPATERAKYEYNLDKEMSLIKFVSPDGKDIGMINWFAVHPVSMNSSNHLISSDNKGYAAVLFEQGLNHGLPGQGKFVGAFAQANEGDSSPNTAGPRCLDTGLPCDSDTSTCNGKAELCIAFGPGKDMFESTQIIGRKQYLKAKELFSAQSSNKISGPIDFRYVTRDMTKQQVVIDGRVSSTCKPAMGYSFAAGTTDGPGSFNFKQGQTGGNLFWNIVRNFIHKPSEELTNCHKPKPILLATGEINFPYEWQPAIVDFQIIRIGQIVIVGLPGEFTTMAGRRIRENVKQVLIDNGYPKNIKVILSGLTNTYAHYITTYEEYLVQRYEGASTIYGPHTHQAMTETFVHLAEAMAKNKDVKKGPEIPNLKPKLTGFNPPVIFDMAPSGKDFGDVLVDANAQYYQGETVTVEFVSANPRSNQALLDYDSFLAVEQKHIDSSWVVVAKDSAWETKYIWERTSSLKGESKAIIYWEIPDNQKPGSYRIKHYGHSKGLLGSKLHYFEGTSRNFKVLSKGNAEDINRTRFSRFRAV